LKTPFEGFVSGRSNATTEGRLKTSHFEETVIRLLDFPNPRSWWEVYYGEPTQDGVHRSNSQSAQSGLVPAAHRARTGRGSRDCLAAPGPGRDRSKCHQCAHRLRGA